jgi:branched-chain amino acid transport system substrate-binding protein
VAKAVICRRKLLATVAWLACGWTAGALCAEPVRIGLTLGLSGQYQAPSAMQKRAYEMWRDEVNQRGGIAGRSVELVIIDDRSDEATASKAYREFLDRRSVDLVFAPYSSGITAAIAPIVETGGYPLLAAGASADDLWKHGYRSIFGVWTQASRYTQGMLRLAHDAGLRRIAIVSADDPFSKDTADGTRRWAPYLKLAIVSDRVVADEVQLRAALEEARWSKADLVIVTGRLEEAVRARRLLAQIGWAPAAFYATVGPALPDWRKAAGDLADDAFSTSMWEPVESVAYPQSRDFADAFRSRYGMDPSYHAATAYASGQILEAGIRIAGTVEPSAVRDAISSLDTYTVLGRFAVDRAGVQVKRFEMIVQWQHGRKEIVWPAEVRTALPAFGTPRP